MRVPEATSAMQKPRVELFFLCASVVVLAWAVMLRFDPTATSRESNGTLFAALSLAMSSGVSLSPKFRTRWLGLVTATIALALAVRWFLGR